MFHIQIQLVKKLCKYQNSLFQPIHALSNNQQKQTIVELFCSGMALPVSLAAFQTSGIQHYDSLLEFKKQMSIMCSVTFMIHENKHSICHITHAKGTISKKEVR